MYSMYGIGTIISKSDKNAEGWLESDDSNDPGVLL